MFTPRVIDLSLGGPGYKRFEYGPFQPGHETYPPRVEPYNFRPGLHASTGAAQGLPVEAVHVLPPWKYDPAQLAMSVQRQAVYTPNSIETVFGTAHKSVGLPKLSGI